MHILPDLAKGQRWNGLILSQFIRLKGGKCIMTGPDTMNRMAHFGVLALKSVDLLFFSIYNKSSTVRVNHEIFNITTFVVLYVVSHGGHVDIPSAFVVKAEDADVAEELCQEKFLGAEIVWVLPDG